jgi:inorganic triphosphatase YgiF
MEHPAQTGAGVEREITLVICSDSPAALADRIADLRAFSMYSLDSGDICAIRDVYFDTEDRLLGQGRWSLRTREIGENRFITAKGPSTRLDGGGVERSEWELPWSHEALKAVLEAIPCLGPRRALDDHPAISDPAAALAAIGLSPVQRRTTKRRARNIRTDQSSPIVAELVVDEVTYELSCGPILHYEVEIEAKQGGDASDITFIAAALREMYAEDLMPWKLGKLATGIVVERLLAQEGPEGFVRDGRLTPLAYERIST